MSARAISSLQNPAVKAARALHLRKSREQSGLFLAEGLKIVTEAVTLGRRPALLLHGPEARDHPLLLQAASAADEVAEVTPAVLAKISRRDNPQVVLGVFHQQFTPLDRLDPGHAATWLALQGIRDPGNLGTIVRTADAAGVGAVILVGSCCDPYSVEAVRATMGSIFAVELVRAETEAFLAWRRTWPGTVVGTHLAATQDFRAAAYRPPCLIVMGAEQSGLTAEMAEACDALVRIPMRGRADSLNLAVATGVMLYAVTG